MAPNQAGTTSTLLNAITESALLMTPEGEIVDLNTTAATRLGANSPADLVGRNAFDSLSPELAASRRAMFDEVVATGVPTRFEDVRNGRTILNSLYPVVVDGEVALVAVFGYDLTDVGARTEDLRQSERWLSESQRIANLGHFTYDIDRRTWSGSPAFNDVLGCDETHVEDISGWLAIVHPDDRDRLQRFFRDDVLGRGLPFDIEYRIVRPNDGEERWVHGRGRLEYHADGHAQTMFGIIQDVTDRKRIEAELLLSQRSLHAILQSTADGILAVDSKGRMLFASDRFAEMWRIPEEVMATGDDAALMDRVLDQLVDPESFVNRVRILYGSDKESLDILEFKDGRVFERLSLPLDRTVAAHGRVWSFRDVTARRQAERTLRQQATTDELTGILNRRVFFESARTEMKRSDRHHEPLAVAYIDVDRLKRVNDRHGHAAGDQALIAFTQVCRHVIRDIDVLARMGGDEFALLMPATSVEQARSMIDRVRDALETRRLESDDEATASITISAGVSGYAGERETLDELLKRADGALYQAKAEGRNRTVIDTGPE